MTDHPRSVLLDTSVIVDHLRSRGGVIPGTSVRLYVPAVVLGKVRYAAQRSRNVSRHLTLLNEFMAATTLLPANETTAVDYGYLRDELVQMRIALLENAIRVAATARQHDLPVATRDAHLQNVDGIHVVSW